LEVVSGEPTRLPMTVRSLEAMATAAEADPLRSWMELIDLLRQLHRAIAEFEAERRDFHSWAARERADIERARRGLRRSAPDPPSRP
jgi:hypothetical protein